MHKTFPLKGIPNSFNAIKYTSRGNQNDASGLEKMEKARTAKTPILVSKCKAFYLKRSNL